MLMEVDFSTGHTYTWPSKAICVGLLTRNIQHARSMATYTLEC
jgi:hypothetical protein